MTGPAAALTVRGLSAWYGQAQALFDVDLDVADGEIVGVLGRNGAGKSTLLHCLARIHPRLRGEITWTGHDLLALDPHRVAELGINLVRSGAKVFSNITVEQNLHLGARLARLRHRPARPAEEIWEWFPALASRRHVKAGYLSGGQRQSLALATALHSSPSLLLLDEPSAGLATAVAATLFEVLRRLRDEGMTLLVVEQDPDWLAGLVHRTVLLETGHVIADGDELLAAPSAGRATTT
jgi:branched-chain amino acid transport system ATP-binding protein